MFQLARFLDELKLNDIEIGILCGILFTSLNGTLKNQIFLMFLEMGTLN